MNEHFRESFRPLGRARTTTARQAKEALAAASKAHKKWRAANDQIQAAHMFGMPDADVDALQDEEAALNDALEPLERERDRAVAASLASRAKADDYQAWAKSVLAPRTGSGRKRVTVRGRGKRGREEGDVETALAAQLRQLQLEHPGVPLEELMRGLSLGAPSAPKTGKTGPPPHPKGMDVWRIMRDHLSSTFPSQTAASLPQLRKDAQEAQEALEAFTNQEQDVNEQLNDRLAEFGYYDEGGWHEEHEDEDPDESFEGFLDTIGDPETEEELRALWDKAARSTELATAREPEVYRTHKQHKAAKEKVDAYKEWADAVMYGTHKPGGHWSADEARRRNMKKMMPMMYKEGSGMKRARRSK